MVRVYIPEYDGEHDRSVPNGFQDISSTPRCSLVERSIDEPQKDTITDNVSKNVAMGSTCAESSFVNNSRFCNSTSIIPQPHLYFSGCHADKHTCQCGKQFASSTALNQHRHSKHVVEVDTSSRAEFKCFCGKLCVTELHLIEHMDAIHAFCRYCGVLCDRNKISAHEDECHALPLPAAKFSESQHVSNIGPVYSLSSNSSTDKFPSSSKMTRLFPGSSKTCGLPLVKNPKRGSLAPVVSQPKLVLEKTMLKTRLCDICGKRCVRGTLYSHKYLEHVINQERKKPLGRFANENKGYIQKILGELSKVDIGSAIDFYTSLEDRDLQDTVIRKDNDVLIEDVKNINVLTNVTIDDNEGPACMDVPQPGLLSIPDSLHIDVLDSLENRKAEINRETAPSTTATSDVASTGEVDSPKKSSSKHLNKKIQMGHEEPCQALSKIDENTTGIECNVQNYSIGLSIRDEILIKKFALPATGNSEVHYRPHYFRDRNSSSGMFHCNCPHTSLIRGRDTYIQYGHKFLIDCSYSPHCSYKPRSLEHAFMLCPAIRPRGRETTANVNKCVPQSKKQAAAQGAGEPGLLEPQEDVTYTTPDGTCIHDMVGKLGSGDYSFEFNRMILTDNRKPDVICSLCQKEGHFKQNCPDEILPDCEPLPPPNNRHLRLLDELCQQVYYDFAPYPEEVECRNTVLADLEIYIRENLYRDARLVLFGSSCNGFGFQDSDLDICMTLTGSSAESLNYVQIIEELGKLLKKHPLLINILPITTAKVPIVKFTQKKYQLEGDISLYNTLAQHNTAMLKFYSELDARVKPLGYTMKVFAKTCDIGDASRGSLSSYAYTLMVIYFLQQRKPPVLPVLQELYSGHEKPEVLIDGWNAWYFKNKEKLVELWPHLNNNKETLGDLWLGMLRFYTEEFQFKEHVISIRQHRPLTRFEKMWTSKSIAIEDPFDLSHNLGAGVSRKMNNYIMKAFIKGRKLFGTPIDNLPPGYRGYEDYFFDPYLLTDGLPPNDRGCRVCGKIGHFVKDCPKNKKNSRKEERPVNIRGKINTRMIDEERMRTAEKHSRTPDRKSIEPHKPNAQENHSMPNEKQQARQTDRQPSEEDMFYDPWGTPNQNQGMSHKGSAPISIPRQKQTTSSHPFMGSPLYANVSPGKGQQNFGPSPSFRGYFHGSPPRSVDKGSPRQAFDSIQRQINQYYSNPAAAVGGPPARVIPSTRQSPRQRQGLLDPSVASSPGPQTPPNYTQSPGHDPWNVNNERLPTVRRGGNELYYSDPFATLPEAGNYCANARHEVPGMQQQQFVNGNAYPSNQAYPANFGVNHGPLFHGSAQPSPGPVFRRN